jgi:peptide/nickel transport system substrate-binding protein
VTDDAARTVTFHLVAPDPEFLDKLALPFASVVPAGTPPHDVGTHPLPATGPYMIASYRPGHMLRLERNPYFHEWSKAAQPDGYPNRIVVGIGGTADRAMSDVIAGRADLVSTSWSGSPSRGRLAAIESQHATQLHTNPSANLWALFLNTRVAPFDRLGVRRAVNYAFDRAAAVQALFGSTVAQATCQILPPNFAGHRAYCPYTAGSTTQGTWTAPDLAKAKALVARSGTRGMKVTVWDYAPVKGFGPLAVKLLKSLGYRASLKVVGDDTYFSSAYDSRNRVQIGWLGWAPDYPAPSGFFGPTLTCASFLPNGQGNGNAAEFCDPRLDRQIKRALAEQATKPDAARVSWERIDRETVDQAPWIPLVTFKSVDILSRRVGNYQYSPNGLLIDQLWVR